MRWTKLCKYSSHMAAQISLAMRVWPHQGLNRIRIKETMLCSTTLGVKGIMGRLHRTLEFRRVRRWRTIVLFHHKRTLRDFRIKWRWRIYMKMNFKWMFLAPRKLRLTPKENQSSSKMNNMSTWVFRLSKRKYLVWLCDRKLTLISLSLLRRCQHHSSKLHSYLHHRLKVGLDPSKSWRWQRGRNKFKLLSHLRRQLFQK